MVSLDTFKNLKKATQILENKIHDKEQHNCNLNNFKFLNISNTHINNSPLLLIVNVFNNPVIRIASNIIVINSVMYDGEQIYFHHPYSNSYLNLVDVYHTMQKLVKMGKSGIKAHYNQNLEIRKNIVKVSKQMNL